MKIATRRKADLTLPGTIGPARVDRRTRNLLARLQPGDVAVVDHLDMDRATAERLVAAEVAAVVNASAFVSGRYPNQGPTVLVDAGIPLVDGVGADALAALRDGREVRVHDGKIWLGSTEDDEPVATGSPLDGERLATELGAARAGMASQLESFTHNATEFLRREEDLLLHGRGLPRLGTTLRGRPVVVVAGGPDDADELRAIRRYLREQDPVLVAVDSGADTLLRAGRSADVVVLSSALTEGGSAPSAKALRGAGEVVVVVDRGSGRTPTDALERLGVRPLRFETAATGEDAALVLAAAGEASVIVGVGVHASLEDFLDRQRGGLASTFLTRLRVGPRLVDARALPQLYAGPVRTWQVWLALLAGIIAVLAAIAVTPVGQQWVDDLRPAVTDLLDRIGGLFP